LKRSFDRVRGRHEVLAVVVDIDRTGNRDDDVFAESVGDGFKPGELLAGHDHHGGLAALVGIALGKKDDIARGGTEQGALSSGQERALGVKAPSWEADFRGEPREGAQLLSGSLRCWRWLHGLRWLDVRRLCGAGLPRPDDIAEAGIVLLCVRGLGLR